ncbi:MAG: SafA/ExsA family spore coat assembly protein [Erysipelotrichales bacterium]|nr:SafA/ExsA family spore coat assembly protein [Erysipelotrichales bacterium]
MNTYTVVPGDSLWRIAVKHQVGISELIAANPQIANPALIFPGQRINIPRTSEFIGFENEVVNLVNSERAKAGLRPLTNNWEISRVARIKSQDFINRNYFSHNSPTYGTPFQMLKSFGIPFSAAAENIASGQRTPAAVMSSWLNSPGHRANIMNPNFNQIGVGVARDNRGNLFWTQMFVAR